VSTVAVETIERTSTVLTDVNVLAVIKFALILLNDPLPPTTVGAVMIAALAEAKKESTITVKVLLFTVPTGALSA
jgi:hypothetical protein